MSVDTITPSLKSMPLFVDFDENQLEGIQRIFQRTSFAPGDLLMIQGHVADTIFFLERGTVEVLVMLPGGGERVISTLGPGSVIGEMALLDEMGTRTASVRAVTPTHGFLIERQDCRMLLTQAQSATFNVQQRITLSLCQRLRTLLALVGNFHTSDTQPTAVLPTTFESHADIVRQKELRSEYRKMLPQLPFLSPFRVDELELVLEQATVLTVPRGYTLFQQGSPGQIGYVIVRGAVELVSATVPPYALSVLGPGRICGQIALIDGAPYEMTAITRSGTILLELPQQAFDQLRAPHTRTATKFGNAILQSLLLLQAKLDNHLARLISQTAIRTQHRS